MTDLSLKSFTAIDRVADLQTYIDALSAFDAIAELQELKQLAARRVLIFPPDLAAAYFASAGTSAHHDGAISDGDLAGWMEGIGELHRKARLFATIGYFLFAAAVR